MRYVLGIDNASKSTGVDSNKIKSLIERNVVRTYFVEGAGLMVNILDIKYSNSDRVNLVKDTNIKHENQKPTELSSQIKSESGCSRSSIYEKEHSDAFSNTFTVFQNPFSTYVDSGSYSDCGSVDCGCY